jgi:hypothetical protein
MSFGHAGTIVEGKEDTATEKIARLAEAGIVVAEEISQIPEIVREQIAARTARTSTSGKTSGLPLASSPGGELGGTAS